jgi:hypothetical protein
MSDYDVERLLEEIRVLARPRVVGDLVRDAAGLFLPGFSALPAVSILSNKSWKTRIKPQPERWRTGDIMVLNAVSGTRADAKQQSVFFTPIGEVVIPLIDMTPGRDLARFEKSIQLKPKDRWEPVELQFACLPWDAEREDRTWTSEDLLAISKVMSWAARELRVSLELGGQQVSITPRWGFSSWIAKSSLDSIRFPINYAANVISPFIFRLQIETTQKLPNGRVVDLTTEALGVNFEFPEDAVRTVYREAGLGQPDLTGISIFGNALPVMNLDLKAWLQGDSFADFVHTAGMKPLGVAGIYPYLKTGKVPKEDLEPITSRASIFSIEIDIEGQMLSGYGLPGETDTVEKKQLLMWMTHGALINGSIFKYGGADIIQPLQKPSLLLNQTATIMPCFGGHDCHDSGEGDWYKRLVMSYSTPPQTLLHRDSLVREVEELVHKLGYDRVTVDQPVTELRVVNGSRRRVIVVYLRNRGGRDFEEAHLAMIQGFVNDRLPVGVDIRVELK